VKAKRRGKEILGERLAGRSCVLSEAPVTGEGIKGYEVSTDFLLSTIVAKGR